MWDGFHDMNGWGWLMMSSGILFWIALVAFAVWAISRMAGRNSAAAEPRSAREVLDMRLARGEIDVEEHARLSSALARGKQSR